MRRCFTCAPRCPAAPAAGDILRDCHDLVIEEKLDGERAVLHKLPPDAARAAAGYSAAGAASASLVALGGAGTGSSSLSAAEGTGRKESRWAGLKPAQCIRFFSRKQRDFEGRYAQIMADDVMRATARCESCIIDGEMLAWDEKEGKWLQLRHGVSAIGAAMVALTRTRRCFHVAQASSSASVPTAPSPSRTCQVSTPGGTCSTGCSTCCGSQVRAGGDEGRAGVCCSFHSGGCHRRDATTLPCLQAGLRTRSWMAPSRTCRSSAARSF